MHFTPTRFVLLSLLACLLLSAAVAGIMQWQAPPVATAPTVPAPAVPAPAPPVAPPCDCSAAIAAALAAAEWEAPVKVQRLQGLAARSAANGARSARAAAQLGGTKLPLLQKQLNAPRHASTPIRLRPGLSAIDSLKRQLRASATETD